jgi:hypothetical protein
MESDLFWERSRNGNLRLGDPSTAKITRMTLRLICGLLVCLFSISRSAASADVSFHEQIQQVYNFQPHLLSNQQISEKSAVLDKFWTRAKSERSRYVPGLREELVNFNNPPFFLYDGSALLLSLSDTPADRKIALAGMSHCDLRDVQTSDYFRQVHRLATLGEDTTAAAFHVLEDPKFKVFIPQHSLMLGQDYVLIYLLLPTDPDYWVQPAVRRLASEQNETAQKSLLLLLWYAQTRESDEAIAAFPADASRPSASRSYAKEIMRRSEKVGRKQTLDASSSTEASLRQKRRERMKSVSDEALIDLDDYTMMLLAKRKQ